MTACNSMFTIMLGSVGVLALAFGADRTPLYLWNASASVPLGLYGLHPSNTRYVGELVAVMPPEPLATFLADGSYLPRGVPMLKHVLAPRLSPHWSRRTLSHELAIGRFIGWSILRTDSVVCRDRSRIPPLDRQGLTMHYSRLRTAASSLDKVRDLSLFPAPSGNASVGQPR